MGRRKGDRKRWAVTLWILPEERETIMSKIKPDEKGKVKVGPYLLGLALSDVGPLSKDERRVVEKWREIHGR